MQAVQLVSTGMIAVKSVNVQMVELVQWMGHAYAPQELLDTTAQSKVPRNKLMSIYCRFFAFCMVHKLKIIAYINHCRSIRTFNTLCITKMTADAAKNSKYLHFSLSLTCTVFIFSL